MAQREHVKGSSQWLNFYRNVNLTQDAGSGGYVYHVMLKSSGATIDIPGFDDPSIVGVIFRYYLYVTGANHKQQRGARAAIRAGRDQFRRPPIRGYDRAVV